MKELKKKIIDENGIIYKQSKNKKEDSIIREIEC